MSPSDLADELLSLVAVHYEARKFSCQAVTHLKRSIQDQIRDDRIVFIGDYKLDAKLQTVVEYFRSLGTHAFDDITGSEDAIFAFSFGYRKSGLGGILSARLPGKNNRALGQIAVCLKC